MKVSDRIKGRAKEPKYSKTKPIMYEDFAEIEKWFKKKTKNENAWKINIGNIKEFNLDSANPNVKLEQEILPPRDLIDQFISVRRDIIKSFEDIRTIVDKEIPKSKNS